MKKLILLIVALLAAAGAKAQDPADVKVLLDTDFTVFTEGSEESPKSLFSSDFNKLATGYSYVSNVAAAGGKLLVKENGYLQLNGFTDLPTAGGTVRVTAEVFMIGFDGMLQYQPGYSSSDYVNEFVESGKWIKVVSLVGNMKGSSRLKIVPFLSINGFYIKSLKVEYSADFIAAPEAYLPNDADGTQFTAACSVNTSATKYEADVFTYDKDGKEVYFVKDLELKKLSAYSTSATAKVTGLNPAETYYYVARCINANGAKSPNSEIVEVVKKLSSIDAPKALEATDVTSSGFTANWESVADARSYLVNVYSKTTLTKEEEMSVFKEDFSGVTVGTESSLEYSGDLNDYTNVKGWITDMSKTFAKGYYVIYPTGSTGTLITPAIDLSAVEGKFKVVLKAATRDYSGFNASADTLKVELTDLDGNVIEVAPIKILDKSGIAEYSFDFTKGVKNSKLSITFSKTADSSMKLFLDDVDVLQTLPAGSVFERQLSSLPCEDGTSLKVVQALEEGIEYSYSVIAVGETVEGSGAYAEIAEIQSDESNRVSVVFKQSGVDETGFADAVSKVWKESAGVLSVTGRNVVVADMSGNVLLRNISDQEQTYTVNYNGIVVVLVDGKSYKIAL